MKEDTLPFVRDLMSFYLSDDDRKTLTALTHRKPASLKIDRLPSLLGVDRDEATRIQADLIGKGLLELWPENLAICVTTKTEYLLDIELRADASGRLTWRGRKCRTREHPYRGSVEEVENCLEDPDNKSAKRKRLSVDAILETNLKGPDGYASLADLESVPPGPMDDEGPYPTIIMGLRMAWPVEHEPGEPCKACRHLKKMPPNYYCAWCHRAGNTRIKPVPEKDRPKAQAEEEPAKPRADGLLGGLGRDLTDQEDSVTIVKKS